MKCTDDFALIVREIFAAHSPPTFERVSNDIFILSSESPGSILYCFLFCRYQLSWLDQSRCSLLGDDPDYIFDPSRDRLDLGSERVVDSSVVIIGSNIGYTSRFHRRWQTVFLCKNVVIRILRTIVSGRNVRFINGDRTRQPNVLSVIESVNCGVNRCGQCTNFDASGTQNGLTVGINSSSCIPDGSRTTGWAK